MMSMFSTSPHVSGAAVSSFTGGARLESSKPCEGSPDQQAGLFQTNPNSIPISSKAGRNTPFWGVSAQPTADSGNFDKQSLASHRIEERLFHYNLTPTRDDRANDLARQDPLHDFKTLSNEERQQVVDKEGEDADLIARTIHLRFLPTMMKQGELADLCRECGEYLRVRICGNAMSNQNWIYGFVEFATRNGANRMMKMSGMELSNGPERPPLRLKCSAAKQRIVDRVFHDANPETGTLCTFGLGSFASRSLKDALESYFNLKTKEAQQQKSKQPPLETWRINSSTGTSLSPNALSFSPSFGTGVHSFAVTTSTRLGDSNRALFASVFPSINQPSVTDSDCSDSPAGITPRFCIPPPLSPIIFSEFPSGAGVTASKYSRLQETLNFVFRTTPDYSNFSSFSRPVGVTVAPSTTEGLPTAAVMSSEASSGQSVATAGAWEVAHGVVLARGLGAAAQLPRGPVTDGAEVVERGRALALEGLRHGPPPSDPSHGVDGVGGPGPMGALLELLDRHRALTGGAAAVGAEGASADLPQAATRLRLLANLVLALGHLSRRSLAGALPFIEATLSTCHDVPLEPVRRPPVSEARQSGPGSLGDPFAPVRPCRVVSFLDEAAIECSPVGRSDELSDVEFTWFSSKEADRSVGCANMFDIIADAPENVLSAVISSLPEEEGEEGYGTKGASALRSQDQGELLRCPPSSLCGGISTIDALTDAEGFYYRDVAFHGYVLSVLMAIGLAMEKVNPLITQKVSELAARYADNVLGMRCTMLDAFLRGGGEPPHTTAGVCLSASVIPELGESHDITTFPHFFFNALNSDLLKALEDPREFWVRLPPLHCLRCIPC